MNIWILFSYICGKIIKSAFVFIMSQQSLFPETMYEYYFLISPPTEIKEYVEELKEIFKESDYESGTLSLMAHISLFTQLAPESFDMSTEASKALIGQSKFNVKITGADHFKNGNQRTLYLKIENHHPFSSLITSLKQKFRKIPKKIVPHISIARHINEADYEKIGSPDPFKYMNEWLCDRIVIIRRVAGSIRGFSPYSEILLE